MRNRAAILLVMGLSLGNNAAAQEPTAMPNDLHLIVGKQVMVGRMALCEPSTYTANLQYAGKQATVISFKANQVAKLSPSALNRMPPGLRPLLEDTSQGGILAFEFKDAKKLDTCVDLGRKQLADNLELVPGQVIASDTPIQPVTAAASGVPGSGASLSVTPANPECPVVVTKLASGDGGFRHFMVNALTTSELQRQIDQATHEGSEKHYLDMRIRNASQKPIAAIESVVIYSDRMGDESLRNTLVSQNDKPINPGQETTMSAMDRDASTQNGMGQVVLYVSRVRFVDNTFWIDNGSHSCALTSTAK
jgi:hypothetical protein